MPVLWAASLRHLMRHPAQLALALLGLSVGVATLVAVDIATASAARAFELSLRAVNGAATHEILGGPVGIDEQLYVDLRLRNPELGFAPIVAGYASIGGQTMQLVGIDPLASPQFEAPASGSGGPMGRLDLSRSAQWFTQAGTIMMAAATAQELDVGENRPFELDIGGRRATATLIGTIADDQAGYDALILTDIAQAQGWLRLRGRLSRIDVRLPAGAAAGPAESRLRAQLPPDVQLEPAQGRTRESIDMTSAFTTNLRAMSLLALMVSLLIIYGTISFAVVQRRRVVGILRALGATPGDVLEIVLAEAAVLGAVGAGVGLLLGASIAHALVGLVSQTINDLYFVVSVRQTVLPASSVVIALLAGFLTALVGALVPAFEAAAGAPQLGLRRSVLESRAVAVARRLALASVLLGLGSAIVAASSGRSLLAGFGALFMLLLSVAALTPAVLRAAAIGAAKACARVSPVGRLAFSEVAGSLSRTGVAVAALGMAIAAMIGVSIMVGSFRESLRAWLERTIRADVYVTAPGAGGPERRIEPELVGILLRTPGVADYSISRHTQVELAGEQVELDALQSAAHSRPGLVFVDGDPRSAWSAFASGSILVSEPLAWRLRLRAGQQLTIPTGSGARSFRIAGIYREYGNDRGNVMMSLGEFRQLWHDESVTGLGIYLRPDTSSAQVMMRLRAQARGRQALLISSNARLRELSMEIFERTFVITRVLYWLAGGVAAVGLLSALLAWELERSREVGLLRALGLTPAGAALLVEAQAGFMGLMALVVAIPAGFLTALMLILVINRRAFGWQIDLHVSSAQLSNALLLSVAAALAAGVYPAWRGARATIADEIREE
ncbi:MAG TPA: FtsX-like permease family protein [Steroidobacteraceae bacterium]|nr:FtsX-like permease family protein [Steroidobacteraceae bacterium]